MPAEQVEVLIIGSGQGGKLLAWHMAGSGRRTAVIERRWIGGACPNIACMPSKNVIWSAKVAHLAHHAGQFGTMAGPVETDMVAVRQRKRDMVNREIELHLRNYQTSGAELIMGSGRFVAPKVVEVHLNDGGTRLIAGDRVFLNLGTHPAVPNIPGLEAARPLTHIEALELDYLPAHLLVFGGGYVGLELAQAWRRFGSRVTVIEPGPRIMGREDPDVADEIHKILSSEGIRFLVGSEILRVSGRSGEAVAVSLRTTSGERTIEGSDIMVAIGRIPNTGHAGLDIAGVDLDDRGYIRVNERLETSAPDVWAIGESAGSPQFTHVSVDDFRIIRDHLAGGRRGTHDRLVPNCMFTDPPLARVGLSETDARTRGMDVRVATLPMSAVLRTEATDGKQGFMKALVDADDLIVGFTMVGSEAGEVMAAVQTAMLAKLPYQRLRDTVMSHLTMAEGLGPLFSNVPPSSGAHLTESGPADITASDTMEEIMLRFDEYRDRFPNARLTRSKSGVLEVALHTDGGVLVFNGYTHEQFVDLFHAIGSDPENRVVILTGSGDAFMETLAPDGFDFFTPRGYDKIYREGKKVLMNILDIEVPMIAAVNGPVRLHSEYILLCDIVLATPAVAFQDKPHFEFGIVPGDGVHLLWQEAIGTIRGRYFILTRQELDVATAKEWGAVNEIVPADRLLPRAREIAEGLASLPPLTTSYTRIALTQKLRRIVDEGVGYGLALEGISAADVARGGRDG